MKNIVVNDEYNPADLKPSALIEQYIALLHKDAVTLLNGSRQAANCPACYSVKNSGHFEKFGFIYHECADCKSLYVNHRPSDAQITSFYRSAPSKIFWRNQLSEASRQQRKERIIKPRFEWITDSIAEYLRGDVHWMDMHTSQARYLETMASVKAARKSVVFPYCDVPSNSGLNIIDKPWWELDAPGTVDVVTLFEVLDHTNDVDALLMQVKRLLKPGGLCFLTAILSSGFDVKELGQHAKNIYPPDRLNVFSVYGLKHKLEQGGFECLEFSTPGVLDLDIVASALKENPAVCVSPFIRELALEGDEDVRRAFAEFLQANLRSSYGRVLIKKKA